MIVFKTFLKILNRRKSMVILYTVMLVGFAGLQLQTSDNSTTFVASKPDVLIINEGNETAITKNFTEYIKKNCTVKNIKNSQEAIDDALFYRDVNYIIYLPENYTEDFLNGKNPEIKVKSTGDYQASFAEMLVSKYIRIANICRKQYKDETKMLDSVNEVLKETNEVMLTSKLDTDKMSRIAVYYNFANYSLLAGCVFVISMTLSSFREEKIRKRIAISSMDYKKHNLLLLVSNAIFAFVLWMLYVILSFVLIGKIMFSAHGLIYILNSFVFTFCCLTIAHMIAAICTKKEAISGIVNVLALGSSFLCGAFIPMEWLPDGVLKVAHVLPTYWYIKTNEILKTMETVNLKELKPVWMNLLVLAGFSALFIVIFNIITKKSAREE